MDSNSEAIYNTKPWDKAAENKSDGVFFTTVGPDLYVHVTKPCDSIKLKGIRKPSNVTVLGSKHNARLSGSKLILSEPLRDAADEMPQVIKLSNAL